MQPPRLPSLAAALAVLFRLALAAAAQPTTTTDALRTLADEAGIIFAGTVTAVRRPPVTPGIVAIDFAVTEPIRGVKSSTYTLCEWAGLWAANDQPFRPGERFLMLLHPPNAQGISSPVAGGDGAIPIRGAGPIALPDTTPTRARLAAVAATSSSPTEVIDLGWVASHVATPIVYARVPSATPITLHPSVTTPPAWIATEPGGPAPAAAVSTIQPAPYRTILDQLHTWEAARAVR